MILLARYGRDKCHVCGQWAQELSIHDKGGVWHGCTETLTYVPLCDAHGQWGVKIPGCKLPRCGGDCGPGTPKEQGQRIKKQLDELFKPKSEQLALF